MSEYLITEEFFWEGTNSIRITGNESGWQTKLLQPVIRNRRFFFDVKIHLRTYLMLFVARKDHPKGFYSSGETSYRYKLGGGYDILTTSHPPFKTGDTIRFYVDKLEKKIHIQVNGGEKLLLYENVDLPDELVIACSRYTDQSDFEVIRISDMDMIEFDEKTLIEEEKKFESFVVDHCGKFPIPLANKTVNFWKPFLAFSKLSENVKAMKEYEGMNKLKLNIDERNLLKLILERDVKIEEKDIVDYFMFFRDLGMKRQMRDLLTRVGKIEGLATCYLLFVHTVLSYESSEMQSMLKEPRVFDLFPIDLFSVSITLALFNQMKDKIDELDKNRKLNALAYMGTMRANLLGYTSIHSPLDHTDFNEVNFDEISVEKLFMELKKGKLSNLILQCNEKKDRTQFRCHLEVLFLQWEYLQKMFTFGGDERDAIVNHTPLTIVDCPKTVLAALLEFFYRGTLDGIQDVGVLIHLMINAEKYGQKRLLFKCLGQFAKVVRQKKASLDDPKGTVEDILDKVGYLLCSNSGGDVTPLYSLIKKFVVPKLENLCNGELKQDKIKELIRYSAKDRKIQELEEVVENQDRKIKSLETSFEELKKLVLGKKKEVNLGSNESSSTSSD